jgi:hypothetical protein
MHYHAIITLHSAAAQHILLRLQMYIEAQSNAASLESKYF